VLSTVLGDASGPRSLTGGDDSRDSDVRGDSKGRESSNTGLGHPLPRKVKIWGSNRAREHHLPFLGYLSILLPIRITYRQRVTITITDGSQKHEYRRCIENRGRFSRSRGGCDNLAKMHVFEARDLSSQG
jgi:hypothetical protein